VFSISTAIPVRAAVSARIVEVFPSAPAMLLPRHSLYVHVEYDSDQPVRLQAKAWRNGQQVPGMNNPSPAYPAGRHEAIAWVALADGESLDELRVELSDARWHPLTHVTETMRAEWSAGAAAAVAPAWVKELNDAQQGDVAAAMSQTSSGPVGSMMSAALLSGMFMLVLAYPVVQIAALAIARGTWRLIAALPLVVMVPTYAFCLYALSRGSNLWPLTAIFLSPPAAIVAGLSLFMGVKVNAKRDVRPPRSQDV
jgi:hypothetical protein